MSVDARELTRRLGGEWANGQGNVPGPGHSRKDRSLALRDDPKTGRIVWKSFAARQPNSDEQVRAYLAAAGYNAPASAGRAPRGCTAARPAAPPKDEPNVEAQKRARALALWEQAAPLDGACLASRYLASRSIFYRPRSALRLHAGFKRPDGTHGPALLSLISHAYSGEPVGVHVVALNDRAEKVGVFTLGLTAGAGVWPDTFDRALVIAEGPETAFSAELQLGVPAVSALSGANMAALYLPHSVRDVIIVADHDANGAGQRYAEEAALRLRSQGRSVVVFRPSRQGWDANDIQKDHRAAMALSLARKGQPILDAATFCNGLVAVPAAALSHPYLRSGDLPRADKSQPGTCRLAAYADLIQLSSVCDDVAQYDGLTVRLYVGDVHHAADWWAARWNTSTDGALRFIAECAKQRLIGRRRPVTPDGRIITNPIVPDVVETPRVVTVAEWSDGVMQLRTMEAANLAERQTANLAERKAFQNAAISIGYEEVSAKPAERENANLAEVISSPLGRGELPWSSEEDTGPDASPHDGQEVGAAVPVADTPEGIQLPPDIQRAHVRPDPVAIVVASDPRLGWLMPMPASLMPWQSVPAAARARIKDARQRRRSAGRWP